MDEQLQDALLGLVEDLQNAKDFAIEQAPEVVQQMVAYTALTSWIVAIGCAVLLIAQATLFHWRFIEKNMVPNAGSYEEPRIAHLFGLLGLLPAVIMCESFGTAIKATCFQKWFIVEYVTKLVG